MKGRAAFVAGLVACALLGLTATHLASALAARAGLVLEPGRARRATLAPETAARLARFDEELVLEYYVTPRDRMPAHLAHLEQDVRAGLAALARGAAGEVRVTVRDPDAAPEDRAALASAGLAPWRARRVEGDGFREEVVWSSLRLAYGARPAVVLNGLGPEEAAALQELVLAHLEELATPRRPRVALDVPAGYEHLRATLATGADVVAVDLDAHPAALDGDVDLCVWLGGGSAGPEQLAALDALRARGGALVVSLESHALRERWLGDVPRVAFVRDPERAAGARALAAHLGLELDEALLLDPRGAELADDAGHAAVVPWRVRSTPDQHDFRDWARQPNAPLVFPAPTAFTLDVERLSQLGFTGRALATASPGAVLAPWPDGERTLAELAETAGTPAPDALLCAELASDDPWRGAVLVLADGALLGDAMLDDAVLGHRAFLGALLERTLSPERRARARVAARLARPLARLDDAARTRWRLFVLLAAPLALVLLALARGERRARGGPRLWPRLAPRAAAALAVVAGLAALAPRVELDATRDGRNRLTPDEHATLAELVAAAGGDVRLASAFSPDAALPPELRPLARETRRLADELAHELDGVRHTALVLDADDARAGALGLARHTFGSRDDEARRVQRAYAALVVEAGERREVLELPGARAFAELRFRVAFALARLAGRADARLALVAERPRLSPAEAALEFQQRGLFAPREADPYGELERLLSENDFAVRRVDAVAPHLAEGTRAALFLQPRRDATPLLTALAELLADGGRALLAAQPYALQARQLERADLRLAFWPRPLFEDLDHELLPALGAPLVHEVLLDRPPGSLAVRTRVDAQDGPRYELQESTQPFFVRATPDADAAPLFVGTGELLLPGAARFALDDATLAQRGLSAQVWLRASDAAWSYAWTGGDLPDEALARAEAAGCTRVPGAPLGLWLRGRFPAATRVEGASGATHVELGAPGDADGALLLLGESELFGDAVLTLPDRAHEAFALRCAAALALDADLAAFLRRERAPAPLAAASDAERLRWRLLVIGAVPLGLALLGLLRRATA